MPSLAVLRELLRELTTAERSVRIQEPDLIMDDPDKVVAYTKAGLEDGVMAPVYLFHAANACDVVCSGDIVVDLGCGPATQLGLIARLNPECSFIGVDLSSVMLEKAEKHISEQALNNVEFREEDITQLSSFAKHSVDAVISTMVLHHLSNTEALYNVFKEVNRILKPSGGIYLVDFGHLKSEKSIDYFAYQYADRQPELFTLDYLYSLRAAFWKKDFKRLYESTLSSRAKFFTTFLMPFMMAIKTPPRRQPEQSLKQEFEKLRSAMPDWHQRDFKDLTTFFGLRGLRSRYL